MAAHDYIDNELKKVSPGRIGTVGEEGGVERR